MPTENEPEVTDAEKIERRMMVSEDAEMRLSDDEKPKLVGYAAKYGKTTNLGYFKEKIKAGAFDEVLKDSDSRALKNHDPNLLLGRESSGTLKLESNSIGLRFEIDVPDTTVGRDTVEEVRRKDLTGCSFAFIVGEDEWKHTEGQPSERTIVKVSELYDVGPVTYPAYEDTSVSVRAMEMAKQPEITPVEEARTEAEQALPEVEEISPERQREINRGYRKAQRIINRNRQANA